MMDWEVAVVILILTVSGGVHGTPQLTASGEQMIDAATDDSVTMTCQAQDLGSSKVNWVFVKQSLTIFHGLDKWSTDPKYSLQHPDSSVYTLLISNITVADEGFYKCEVHGTNVAVTFELNVTDSSVPSQEDFTPEGPFNRTGCCQQRGISEECLSVCDSPSGDTDSQKLEACSDSLPDYIYCGSDGRNHENCCAREGVPAGCLMLCSNDPLLMPTISSDHLYCLGYFQAIVSCYQFGGALIPSPPQSVSVLPQTRNGTTHLLISWKEPMYNPSEVIGYLVFYKTSTNSAYIATPRLQPNPRQYLLPAMLNVKYSIYVVAAGHHGSSQASEITEITVDDTSSSSGVQDIDICCGLRGVNQTCQDALCVPHLWTTFDVNAMVECYEFLPDIFACLNDERNHTSCCSNNDVSGECLPMCSGFPPPFNDSLGACIPKLPVMEACVQQGLSTQPPAPTGLSLDSVTAQSIILSWADPSVTGRDPVDAYHVQLRRGNKKALWYTKTQIVGTRALLGNLTESENYAVRVIAQVGNVSSLPSVTIRFRTFPETIPPVRPTVAHNLTKCCEDSGMPEVCSNGCIYGPNMTKYYAQVLDTCKFYIGTVLTCAADGRNHIPCCMEENVKEVCHGMCKLNSPGPLDLSYLACLNETATIVGCFQEGLEDLVRMPENVMVTNLTSHTITVQWNNPETGPTPDKYEVDYMTESQPDKV